MTPEEDIQRLRRRVLEEVAEHLRETALAAPGYVSAYVESVLDGTLKERRPPSGMHPKAAALIRDLALDVITAERMR